MMAEDRSDEQLLRAFLAGRRPALGELARRYERSLLGFAKGLLGGREDLACDGVQETWVRVIRFARSFDGRSRFKTWLYRIALTQCRNLLKMPRSATPEKLREDPVGEADPQRTAQQDDLARRVHEVVERLPTDRREIVLLCYHAGMTHEQAAEILEIPLGTLKSRLHAALGELREQLSVEMKP